MCPVDNSHDETDSQAHEDQLLGPEELSQERDRSERRDRNFVRRALRRGVPAQQIEDRLLAATEFLRLNPQRDPIADVRALIVEDGGGLGNVESRTIHVSDPSVSSSTQHKSASSDRATQSEATARRYIQENFEAADWLAVVVRNRETGETVQRITTAQQIASPEFQSWLRHKNAHGCDIYLSLNTLKEHTHGRTKADVKQIRHLYLDLDKEGQQKLAAIYQNPSLPHPNHVLQTSADKYQVIWRVEGIPLNQAEDLLREMAQRFGGDPAATDATRVFRLPGFNNKKYEHGFQVKLLTGTLPERVYHRSDFKIEIAPPEPRSTHRAGTPVRKNVHPESETTQSERDWAYAIRHLRQGANPQDIVQEIASYRATDRHGPQGATKLSASKKANPRYYAEHTVSRAMAHLGMTTGTLEQPSDQNEAGRLRRGLIDDKGLRR